MSFNYFNSAWIPVQTVSGERRWIRPSECSQPDILWPDSPRSDFNAAYLQFLIGALQTAYAPDTESAWKKMVKTPPSTEALDEAFSSIAQYFSLDGFPHRAFQDMDVHDNDNPISEILPDYPTNELFNRTTPIQKVSVEVAAAAILNMQLHAPEGGRGHYTSARGGGPMTTILRGRNLWHTVWLNILPKDALGEYLIGNPELNEPANIFPWLQMQDQADQRPHIGPHQAHPLSIFWASPRRIQIVVEKNTLGMCDLEPEKPASVQFYRRKPNGSKFDGWKHPLTPWGKSDDRGFYSAKLLNGITSYKQWQAIAFGISDGSEPSAVLLYASTMRERQFLGEKPEIFACQYDFNSMKARAWYEFSYPFLSVSDKLNDSEKIIAWKNLKSEIENYVKISEECLKVTQRSIKSALRNDQTSISFDSTFMDSLNRQFWSNTEAQFFSIANEVGNQPMAGLEKIEEIRNKWFQYIRKECKKLFQMACESSPPRSASIKRISEAGVSMNRILFSEKFSKKLNVVPRA